MRKNKFRTDPKETYLFLAKWLRRREYYELLQKIERERAEYKDKRIFSSDAVFRANDGNDFKTAWNFCRFPSKIRKDVVYSASVKTCQYVMNEDVYWRIWNQVYDEAQGQPEDENWMEPDPDNDKKLKKDRLYISKWREAHLEMFDGRTRIEEIDRRFKLWFAENLGKYEIYEHSLVHSDKEIFEIDDPLTKKGRFRLSKYGVVLDVVLDKPAITFDVLVNFIENFWASGEKAFIASAPVPQEHLIYSVSWQEETETSMAVPINRKD